MFFRSQPDNSDLLELKFGIASPQQWAGGPVASPAKLLRNLDDDFESPQLLLKEALFQIRSLNRTTLAPAKRLKLAAALQQRLWPTLAAARDALRKNEDGVPEPQAQRDLLDIADQCTSALVACQLLVVTSDYRADGRLGRTEQARILEATTRVYELIHLQQRMRALRFQPLPPSAWQAINGLYCALSRAHVEDSRIPALCDDRLLLDNDGTTTPGRIYQLIQAFGLFDCFSWSKRRQRFLDSYCTALSDAVSISYQPQAAVGGIVRFAHAQHDGAPTRSATPGVAHRILIDCNVLAEAVRRDKDSGRKQLAEMSEPTANCIAGLPPLARRPILRAMLRSLEHGVPPYRPHEGQSNCCDFRVETGFNRVGQHLQAVFTSDPAKRADMQHNAAFSGRSASQGDTAERAEESQWVVLMQSDQHTVIRTKETRYTKPISLGALAVYGVGEEGFMRPAIGEVSRIVRLDEGQLVVGITHRARFATLVNVFAAVGEDNANTDSSQVPCLLAFEDTLGWCVISSPQSSLPVGCPIQIRTRKLRVSTRLRSLRTITPHFMLFELDEMNPRLGTPTYPSSRRRYRHSRIVMTSQMINPTEPNQDLHRRRRKTG